MLVGGLSIKEAMYKSWEDRFFLKKCSCQNFHFLVLFFFRSSVIFSIALMD